MLTSVSKMPETSTDDTLRDSRTSGREVRQIFSWDMSIDEWMSKGVLCLMAVTVIALFWFPVKRSFANVEVNYNEGWNAYRAAMVANKIPLYGAPPQGFGTTTAYPPLSFHLIGWLGRASTFTAIGRGLSLVSLCATAVFVFLIVRYGGGSRNAAIFSFLLYGIGIALLRADRIGMNDPQLLAEALSMAGLFFYVRNPNSHRLLCASAILFCLAGFTKHTLIAFPAAVAIDLLFRSRKGLVTWAGVLLVSVGFFTAITLLVDGPYFPHHLMGGGGKRAYSSWMAWSGYHHYVGIFQSLLVIATAWSIRSFRSHRVLALAFVWSHLLAFWMAGGFGVDLNIFFNALATTVIACGMALSDITVGTEKWRPAGLPSAAAVMFAIFFVSIMIFVPGQLRRDRQGRKVLSVHQIEFESAIEFVKSRSGPALCESLLLCYEAGKPFEYEPFSVRDLVKTGRLSENDGLQLLRTHHFQTVQIALRADEADLKDAELRASLSSDQTLPDTERRFTPGFMKELLEDYQLSKRTSEMAIFCPQ
jgi:hypothetical protein